MKGLWIILILVIALTACSPVAAEPATAPSISEAQALDAEFERVIAAWLDSEGKVLPDILATAGITSVVEYRYDPGHPYGPERTGMHKWTPERILQVWPSGIIRTEWEGEERWR